MALDKDEKEFLAELGHDGSEIIWEDLPEPENRRAHHVQECIEVALRLGFSVTPVEIQPYLANRNGDLFQVPVKGPVLDLGDGHLPEASRRFLRIIQTTKGVLEGHGPSGKRHAVAYEKGQVFDPDGREYQAWPEKFAENGFFPTLAWIVK